MKAHRRPRFCLSQPCGSWARSLATGRTARLGFRVIAWVVLFVAVSPHATAQTPSVVPTIDIPNRTTSLFDQLVSRLRATTDERRSFIRFVVRQVAEERLEVQLVVAIERYAIRRNPQFPFPFFERAIRVEALKRGVTLPASRRFVTTASAED